MTRYDWRGEIQLVQPLSWRAFGVWATFFPLVLLNAVVKKFAEGEFWEASSILVLAALLSFGGLRFWIRIRRRIVVWAGGVEIAGGSATGIRWDEVESVKGYFVDRLEFIAADGRRIEVASTMRGWRELLATLPSLVEPRSKRMAEEAIRRVALPGNIP